ncbi:hypothetical protein [Paenibacillus sp. FSL K6-1566]|uniref:hypothetical protein n=1 Tax=unclassified Paenibacillus TaxID=185978 RepID=UPI0031017E46
MKKIAVTLTSLLLAFSIGGSAISFADAGNEQLPTQEQIQQAEETQKITDQIYENAYKKAEEEIEKEKTRKSISLNIDNAVIDEKAIYDKYREAAKEENKKFLLENGWSEVSETENVVTPLSTPSQLAMTDETILYNSSTKQYQFSGEFNFTDLTGWDNYADTYDVLAIRSNNQIGIVKSYATTTKVEARYCGSVTAANRISYKESQSGYDNNGVPIANSKVTKQKETANGVIWTIDDTNAYSSSIPWSCGSAADKSILIRSYDTDHGRATLYFTKIGSASTNKVFLDFEHNWKTHKLDASATISGTGLKDTQLTVTYKSVNNRYPRTSTGRAY